MANNAYKINRQTTHNFDITFQNSDGTALDLTGYTVWFTVRDSIPTTDTSDNDEAIISKTYDGEDCNDTGIISVELTATETDVEPKNYLYDIQYKKPDGSIHNSSVNYFIVKADITRGV